MEHITKETGLVLNNYKDPLLRVPKPFHGYQGATLVTKEGTAIQCHICGELFIALGPHIYREHKINAKAYKEKFGLRATTSLTSEKERDRRKMAAIRWFNGLSAKARREYIRRQRANWNKVRSIVGNRKRKKHSLESLNLRGSCPDQIAAQLTKCAEEIGHTPSRDEFIRYSKSGRYVALADYRFGTWNKALEYAKLKPRARFVNKGAPRRRYDAEELLDMLIVFHQETGKVPSETDCRMGLLPNREVFRRRFGSLRNARHKAGIFDEPHPRYVSPFGKGLVKTGFKTRKRK